MQSNRECIQMQIRHLYAKRKCFTAMNRHSVLIFCHFLFSSPQPYLQPLLSRSLCLLQCHHSLCFIYHFPAPAPSFLAIRRSHTLDVTVISSWIFPPLNASLQLPILKSPTPIKTILVTILLMRECELHLNNVHINIRSPRTCMWVIALVKYAQYETKRIAGLSGHVFYSRRASLENMYERILGSLCMVPFRSPWYRTRQMLLFNLHSHLRIYSR